MYALFHALLICKTPHTFPDQNILIIFLGGGNLLGMHHSSLQSSFMYYSDSCGHPTTHKHTHRNGAQTIQRGEAQKTAGLKRVFEGQRMRSFFAATFRRRCCDSCPQLYTKSCHIKSCHQGIEIAFPSTNVGGFFSGFRWVRG